MINLSRTFYFLFLKIRKPKIQVLKVAIFEIICRVRVLVF